MNCIRAPNIKVYSRGPIGGVRGAPTRPFVLSDSEGETEGSKGPQTGYHHIEDDLNWTSKYLSSDRRSGALGSGRRSGVPLADDFKSLSSAPGKYSGSPRSEDSGIFGSHGSIGRRSKSPSTFSENSEDEVMRGSVRRQVEYYQTPLHFHKRSASPVIHRNLNSSSKGYLDLQDVNVRSTSPSMMRPVTRTYDDLNVSRPGSLTASYAASNGARPGAGTRTNFDVSLPGSGYHSEVVKPSPGRRTETDLDSRAAARNPKTKRPVSLTRKKLRNVLCRTKNDPHYFDDDF